MNFFTWKKDYSNLTIQEWKNEIKKEELILIGFCKGEYNQIGNACAQELSKALVDNHNLTLLDLSANMIGPEGLQHLSQVLTKDKHLRSLNLSRNVIGNLGVRYLSEALKTNSTLKHLILHHNQIENKGIDDLSSALKENTTLQSLELIGNQVGDEGVSALSLALEKNNALTKLSLNSNLIGTEAASKLRNVLKKNRRLTELDVMGNEATAIELSAFPNTVEKRDSPSIEKETKQTSQKKIENEEEERSEKKKREHASENQITQQDIEVKEEHRATQRKEIFVQTYPDANFLSDEGKLVVAAEPKDVVYYEDMSVDELSSQAIPQESEAIVNLRTPQKTPFSAKHVNIQPGKLSEYCKLFQETNLIRPIDRIFPSPNHSGYIQLSKPSPPVQKPTKVGDEKYLNILFGVLKGINFLHSKGIVHGALSPSNISLDSEGIPQLYNFQILGDRFSNKKRNRFFEAPETYNPDFDKKRDLWSFGMLIAYWYAGISISEYPDHEKILTQVTQESHQCADILKRCLNPNPFSRPEAGALINDPFWRTVNPNFKAKLRFDQTKFFFQRVDDVTKEQKANMQEILDLRHPDFRVDLGEGTDVSESRPYYDKLEVVQVARIRNQNTNERYRLFQKQLERDLCPIEQITSKLQDTTYGKSRFGKKESNHKNINEILLLSGTKSDHTNSINTLGFSEKKAKIWKNMFGVGIYFTEYPSKADQYTQPDSKNGDLCQMYLSNVTMGRAFTTKKSLSKVHKNENYQPDPQKENYNPFKYHPIREANQIPQGTAPNNFHSVVAEVGEDLYRYREFITYDSFTCSPDFLISYRRTTSFKFIENLFSSTNISNDKELLGVLEIAKTEFVQNAVPNIQYLSQETTALSKILQGPRDKSLLNIIKEVNQEKECIDVQFSLCENHLKTRNESEPKSDCENDIQKIIQSLQKLGVLCQRLKAVSTLSLSEICTHLDQLLQQNISKNRNQEIYRYIKLFRRQCTNYCWIIKAFKTTHFSHNNVEEEWIAIKQKIFQRGNIDSTTIEEISSFMNRSLTVNSEGFDLRCIEPELYSLLNTHVEDEQINLKRLALFQIEEWKSQALKQVH